MYLQSYHQLKFVPYRKFSPFRILGTTTQNQHIFNTKWHSKIKIVLAREYCVLVVLRASICSWLKVRISGDNKGFPLRHRCSPCRNCNSLGSRFHLMNPHNRLVCRIWRRRWCSCRWNSGRNQQGMLLPGTWTAGDSRTLRVPMLGRRCLLWRLRILRLSNLVVWVTRNLKMSGYF